MWQTCWSASQSTSPAEGWHKSEARKRDAVLGETETRSSWCLFSFPLLSSTFLVSPLSPVCLCFSINFYDCLLFHLLGIWSGQFRSVSHNCKLACVDFTFALGRARVFLIARACDVVAVAQKKGMDNRHFDGLRHRIGHVSQLFGRPFD